MVTQRLEPMPPIQKRYERGFFENVRSSRRGSFTLLGTGHCGGICDAEWCSHMVESIHTKELYEGKNESIAYIAERNLIVDNPIDAEQQVLVAIVGNIKFSHLQSRDSSLRSTVTGHYRHLCDLFVHIGRRKQIYTRRGMKHCRFIC